MYAHEVLMQGVKGIPQRQRKLIAETFEVMEKETSMNGLSIFMRMFQEYPAYKDIFPRFRNITDSSLMGATELQRHGVVYMQGLGEIIRVMDDDKALGEQVKKIAMSHKRKGVHKYHVEHMLPMVLATLKHSLPPDELTEEITEAWKNLFTVIAELIENLKLEDAQ